MVRCFENGGEPFTFKNGSIGNVADQKSALVDGAGIVFDNVLFHDIVLKTDGVHTECAYIEVPRGDDHPQLHLPELRGDGRLLQVPGLVVATSAAYGT